MKRMYELKERFEQTMPATASPLPTDPPDVALAASSSSSSYNTQPNKTEKVMCDEVRNPD